MRNQLNKEFLDISRLPEEQSRLRVSMIAFVLGLLFYHNPLAARASQSITDCLETKTDARYQTVVVTVGETSIAGQAKDRERVLEAMGHLYDLKNDQKKIVALVVACTDESDAYLNAYWNSFAKSIDDTIPTAFVKLNKYHKDKATGLYSLNKILSELESRDSSGRFAAVSALFKPWKSADLVTISKESGLFMADGRLLKIWSLITLLAGTWVMLDSDQLTSILRAARLANQQA